MSEKVCCKHIYIKGAKNGQKCTAPIAKAADNNGYCCTHKALQNKETFQCEGFKKAYIPVSGGLFACELVRCETMVHSNTKRCQHHKLRIHRHKINEEIVADEVNEVNKINRIN